MQKTACDTSVYKKQCGAMDAESPMDIGECGKYQARSFFEDCSTCPSGCVDAPTSSDSGSGSNDGGSGDTGTVAVCDEGTSMALGLLMATSDGCKTVMTMAAEDKEVTDAQACDCLTTLGDNAAVKEMKCKMGAGMSETVADLAAGKGACAMQVLFQFSSLSQQYSSDSCKLMKRFWGEDVVLATTSMFLFGSRLKGSLHTRGSNFTPHLHYSILLKSLFVK